MGRIQGIYAARRHEAGDTTGHAWRDATASGACIGSRTVSAERAFGEAVHRVEEHARGLPAIGEGNMELEVRLGTAHGQAPHRQSGTPGQGDQCVGMCEGLGIRVMHDHAAGGRGLAHRPFPRYAGKGIAMGPAYGIECFEFAGWRSAQHAADDERIAPAADAAERPHPGQIARLQKNHQSHAGEWVLAVADHHLDDGRTQPAHGGAAAERRQAALHPAHERVSCADVPDRAGGKPANDHDRGGTDDDFRHGGPDDNTSARGGWRRTLREFLYGLSGYEIAQEALEIRASMETLFMLGVFGEMLGVPVLPPYYGLRLLPFVVPQIETWKRRVLRERELGSDHEHHLHGV